MQTWYIQIQMHAKLNLVLLASIDWDHPYVEHFPQPQKQTEKFKYIFQLSSMVKEWKALTHIQLSKVPISNIKKTKIITATLFYSSKQFIFIFEDSRRKLTFI